MAKVTTLTYDLSLGAGTVAIQQAGVPLDGVSKVAMQLTTAGDTDGTATFKLQESLISGSLGLQDIVGATQQVNTSSDSYVGNFDAGGIFLSFNVVIGTATAGIVTITLQYS